MEAVAVVVWRSSEVGGIRCRCRCRGWAWDCLCELRRVMAEVTVPVCMAVDTWTEEEEEARNTLVLPVRTI